MDKNQTARCQNCGRLFYVFRYNPIYSTNLCRACHDQQARDRARAARARNRKDTKPCPSQSEPAQ